MRKVLIAGIIFMFIGCTNYYDECTTHLKYIKSSLDRLREMRKDSIYAPIMRKIQEDEDSGKEALHNMDNGNSLFDNVIEPSYIDGYRQRGDTAMADKLDSINDPLSMLYLSKQFFLEKIGKVKDDTKRAQLVWEYERIYILRTDY